MSDEEPKTNESETKGNRTRSRKLFYIGLSIVTLLVLSGTILLNIDATRRKLVLYAVDTLNSYTSLHIELKQLQTDAIGDWQFESIKIFSHQALLVHAQSLDLSLSILKLLNGDIHIRHLTVKALDVFQVPKGKSEKKGAREDKNFVLPDISLALKSLDIASFQYHNSSFSTPEYRLKTAFEYRTKQFLHSTLILSSCNDKKTQLDLAIEGSGESDIHLRANFSEDGGWMGRFMKLPESSRISARLNARLALKGQTLSVATDTLAATFAEHTISISSVLAYHLNTRNLSIEPSQFSMGESINTFSGTYENDIVDININTQRLPLDGLGIWLADFQRGWLDADLHVVQKSGLTTLDGTLNAEADYKDRSFSLSYTGTASDRSLDIGEFKLASGDARVALDGSLDLVAANSKLEFHIENVSNALVDVFDATLPESLSFKLIRARGEVLGSLTDPNVTFNMHAEGRYKGRPLMVTAKVSADRKTVNVHQTELTSGLATAAAWGLVGIDSKTLDLKLRADQFPVELLRVLNIDIPESLSAKADASVQFQGTWQQPVIEGRLKATGAYDNYDFNLETAGGYRQNIATIESLHWNIYSADAQGSNQKQQHSYLTGHGSVNLKSKKMAFQTLAADFPLAMVEALGVPLPNDLQLMINGKLDLDGVYDKPKAVIDISASGAYQAIELSLNADAVYENKTFSLNNLSVDADQRRIVTVAGKLKGDDFSLDLTVARVPESLWSALDLTFPINSLEAKMNASGTLYNPSIYGFVSYEANALSVNSEGKKTENIFIIRSDISTDKPRGNTNSLDYEKNIYVKTNITRNQMPAGDIDIVLPVPVYGEYLRQQTGEFPLRASLKSSFNLEALGLFLASDLHKLSGELTTDFQFSGSVTTPLMTGRVSVVDSRYENGMNGIIIDNIHCTIDTKRSRFVFRNCSASDDQNGSFAVTGEVTAPMNGDGGIDAMIDIKQARLVDRADVESSASGQLKLRGDFSEVDLSGRLEISPLMINTNASFGGGIPTLQIKEVYADDDRVKTNISAVAMPDINLNLDITATNQAFLRGRGLDVELGGNIALRGTLKKLVYTGQFETIRGSFEVFSKKFKLARGKVSFANNAVSLLIEGHYKKLGQSVTALVVGTLSDLNIELSANPAMAQDEIIAYLIFGKSILDITPFEAVRLASELQSLRSGGAASFDPISTARDFLGVDSLSIESSDAQGGINVGLGKYLNERVYLELEHSPNPVQPWKGRVEIELAPNLNLESSAGGENGIEGAQLIWTNDY